MVRGQIAAYKQQIAQILAGCDNCATGSAGGFSTARRVQNKRQFKWLSVYARASPALQAALYRLTAGAAAI
jgi:hypothetical protein